MALLATTAAQEGALLPDADQGGIRCGLSDYKVSFYNVCFKLCFQMDASLPSIYTGKRSESPIYSNQCNFVDEFASLEMHTSQSPGLFILLDIWFLLMLLSEGVPDWIFGVGGF